jgi:hypothetical protein
MNQTDDGMRSGPLEAVHAQDRVDYVVLHMRTTSRMYRSNGSDDAAEALEHLIECLTGEHDRHIQVLRESTRSRLRRGNPAHYRLSDTL